MLLSAVSNIDKVGDVVAIPAGDYSGREACSFPTAAAKLGSIPLHHTPADYFWYTFQ